MYEDRILMPALRGKIISAQQAAEYILPNMTLGFSGFTAVGYPKAIPQAIAQKGTATNLTVIAGASAGDELDGALARAGLVGARTPFNVNKDLRNGINSGCVRYTDQHLGHLPESVWNGSYGKVDYAIIECCGITEDGGVIPTLSVGASNTLIACSEHVLLELNLAHPMDIYGIHDIFTVGKLPCTTTIPVMQAGDRIGGTAIPCDPNKIVGIVIANAPDGEPRFVAPSDTSNQIAEYIIHLLKSEVDMGRLPKNFTIQSGFGAVANAVLYGLDTDAFDTLNMYTEVVQDGALDLILKGRIKTASATSLSLSTHGRELFYQNLEQLKERFVIRPQDVSNNCAVIRRLGVVAMNTAIEADIYGNVNSTHIMGTSMMNGIGGSGDFARNGGLSIFMTPSTAKGGAISSIVPMVSHVDHTEHDVQIIVTECGIADLRGKSPRERAELIIENCCHPDYRPALRDYYERAKAVAKGQHTPHDLNTALSWHQRYLDTGSMK